jgi:hypothetical protein
VSPIFFEKCVLAIKVDSLRKKKGQMARVLKEQARSPSYLLIIKIIQTKGVKSSVFKLKL